MQENDVERYLKESCKTYKECKAKNSARRNSLQKRTLGIEAERRMVSANFNREEKLLREQLKQMKIDKMKFSIINTLRDKECSQSTVTEEPHIRELRIPTEPYPITLRPLGSPKTERKHDFEKDGQKYARARGRRVSKEFEDLHLNTKTGTLNFPQSQTNMAKRLMKDKIGITRSLTTLTSPGTQRRKCLSRKHSQNSDHSSPSQSISSMENIHWIGEPEATKSIRRNRKTVEEQELITEYNKLAKHVS